MRPLRCGGIEFTSVGEASALYYGATALNEWMPEKLREMNVPELSMDVLSRRMSGAITRLVELSADVALHPQAEGPEPVISVSGNDPMAVWCAQLAIRELSHARISTGVFVTATFAATMWAEYMREKDAQGNPDQ